MSVAAEQALIVRRFADDQMVSFAKLVIEMAFQPIAEVSTGFVFGYESLVRGFDKLGFNSPLDLIDHASQHNQLAPLEQLLIGRSVVKFADLHDDRNRMLFINFDSRLIEKRAWMLESMLHRLRQAQIPPSNVCIELSERFDNTAQSGFHDFVKTLKAHGFKLAIDDFGVGFSGLKLIGEVAVDFLKIDRHFVHGLDRSAHKRHLMRNMISLAHVLGVKVIAEGVETEAELACCRALGCDLVQGWFIARPTVHPEELQATYSQVPAESVRTSRAQSIDEILIRRQIEQLPTLRERDSIEDAFDLFKLYPHQSFFPVLDARDTPVGIVHEQKLKSFIYHPYGRDLLRNKMFQRSLASFITASPIADLSSDAEGLLDIFSHIEGSECLILTQSMRYAGVLSAAALLRIINEKQIKSAQDQNPLTALPGNGAIRDYVNGALLDGDCIRFFCYCDFDFFKPFNDHYGFQRGDQAIALFAALMRRHFVGRGCLLGHVGGDDFFLGITGLSRSTVEKALRTLLEDFRTEVALLYDPLDRDAGFIREKDRASVVRNHPLMRCSVAALELPVGLITSDISRIGAEIALLKGAAKASTDGLIFAEFGSVAESRLVA